MRRILIIMLYTLSLFAQEQEAEAPLQNPPDPAHLKATWWSYYDVDHERLAIRIMKTQESFNRLKEELSFNQKELALPLMQQVMVTLSTYQDLSQKKPTYPPIEPHRHEVYNYQEFLNLIEALSVSDLLYDSINQQIKIEKGNLRSDQSHLDTLMASYLSSSKSNPARVINGLKIMSRKISVEIDKKKLILTQERAKIRSEEISELESEILFARENINDKGIEQGKLKGQIEIERKKLIAAQEELIRNQAAVINNRSLIANEKVLYFTLKRAEAEVLLMDAELKSLLAQILTQTEKKSVQELYEKINHLKAEEALILQELPDWKNASDLYLELALSEGNPDTLTLAQDIGMLIQRIERNQRKNGYLFVQAEAFIHAHYTTLKDRFIEGWEITVSRVKVYSKWSHKSLFKIGETPITLYGILKVIIVICITIFLAKFIQIWIKHIGKKQHRIHQAGIYTLSRITYYVILFIGIIIAISGIGLDFTTFAVIAGALSVGIGFGLQSIVNNFVSGVIILLEKKLRVGDLVELETKEIGRVMEINVRTTLVKTFDNVEILVPNADLVSKKFINWTLSDKVRRIRIPFGVAFGTDKSHVRDVIIAAAKKIPITTEDREPQVWLTKIGESSLDFELVVWVNESKVSTPPMGTAAWYTWEVESALCEHNITIPFPVRDIHISQNK